MPEPGVAQVISWGNQQRVRCPDCQIIIGIGPRVVCKRCGAVYVQTAEKTYERETSA